MGNRAYSALYWYVSAKHSLALLPFRSIWILFLFICAFAAVAGLTEFELTGFEKRGLIISDEWTIENRKIGNENYKKIQNSFSSPLFVSLGYSGPEFKPGHKRILVVGDSFIWGDGLTNINMTWWRQLQWELRRRGFDDVDIIAAGTNGASTQDELNWFTEGHLFEQTKPDAVIFGYVTNDPDMKDQDGVAVVPQSRAGPLVIHARRLQRLFGSMFPILTELLFTRVSGKEHANNLSYAQWELKILEGENFELYKTMLRSLKSELDRWKVPAFFVTTPNSPNKEYFQQRIRPVKAAFHDAGVAFYDILPQFVSCCAKLSSDSLVWAANPANGHPGPRATAFIANQVSDILQQHYPAVLGERSIKPSDAFPLINDWMPASVNVKFLGDDRWTFGAPTDNNQLLFMPLREHHIALNFANPVSIARLKLSAKEQTSFKVWATILDDQTNAELRDYKLVGQGVGTSVSIRVPEDLASKRITSLKLAATSDYSRRRYTIGSDLTLPVDMKIDFNQPAVQP